LWSHKWIRFETQTGTQTGIRFPISYMFRTGIGIFEKDLLE
jgi:hypothetical protein